jgi:FAD/FMN-containing dehydrogenase
MRIRQVSSIVLKIGAAILELCVEVGGTITGEHGLVLKK